MLLKIYKISFHQSLISDPFYVIPQSFSAIREIIEEFSSYSGLKINHSKTSIISNSPILLSSFRSIFSQGKTLTSTKILGITFSFHKTDLSKNWDDLIRSLPHTSLATLNPKDFLFSKTISLNQHFLPRILFLSRIIPPTRKQIKSLTTLLFKFLWKFSPFEPIKKSSLYLPKSDGVVLPSLILDSKLLQLFYGNSSIFLKPLTLFLIFGCHTQSTTLELKSYL